LITTDNEFPVTDQEQDTTESSDVSDNNQEKQEVSDQHLTNSENSKSDQQIELTSNRQQNQDNINDHEENDNQLGLNKSTHQRQKQEKTVWPTRSERAERGRHTANNVEELLACQVDWCDLCSHVPDHYCSGLCIYF
jgi:hypothetical protein